MTVTDLDFFPNIKKLLKIGCAFAVTNAECECSISRKRILKTYMHSAMTDERLNGLAMLYVHRYIECDPRKVVDEFAKRNPQRIVLTYPISENKDD